jgi:cysteine desulfuration protein SufE
LVRGLIALVLRVYSNATPQQILAAEPHFVREIGLDAHLSPTRANGLAAMIKQIKLYGVAFQSLMAANRAT